LVHSLGATGAFEPADGQAAHNFGAAAREAGVRRVIYLGGLEDCRGGLSAHWHSGQEVEDILRAYDVQVIQFRASIIIGSGRLSFEMIRALVEQLPLMRTPRWVASPALPVAMSDVVRYLLDGPRQCGYGRGLQADPLSRRDNRGYYGAWLWQVRRWLDLLVGREGMR
jgi:uncharacterized protein YbjT (DUF2867 family)